MGKCIARSKIMKSACPRCERRVVLNMAGVVVDECARYTTSIKQHHPERAEHKKYRVCVGATPKVQPKKPWMAGADTNHSYFSDGREGSVIRSVAPMSPRTGKHTEK